MYVEEEYSHWPADDEHEQQPPTAVPGYDTSNGLRSHTYIPPNLLGVPSNSLQTPVPLYCPEYAPGSGQPQYVSHLAPGYLPPVYAAPPQYYAPAPGLVYAPPPVYAAPVPAPQASATQPNTWIGRTKAQVDEDNQIIAAREGVWDPRKVAPINVKDTQLFWVVHPDESTTLQYFMDIQELEGKWQPDSRFKDGWYFIEGPEKKTEKKAVPKKKAATENWSTRATRGRG